MRAIATSLIALLGFISSASASETYLWIVDEPAGELQQDLENALSDAVSRDPGATHIVGRAGISERIAERPRLPGCVRGTERCVVPESTLLRYIGADIVVRVVADIGDDATRLSLSVSDAELRRARIIELSAPTSREALLRAVGAVTGATARLVLRSSPSGATIFIDDESVGEAPIERTLSTGIYRVRAELDGYYPVERPVELRAGDTITQTITLERRFGDLIVQSSTPGAEVFIDSIAGSFAIGEPIPLEPGSYAVEVRAPGYSTRAQQIDISAGDERELRVSLLLSQATLAARQRDAILARPLKLQVGGSFQHLRHGFDGMSGEIFGAEQEIRCTSRAGEDCAARGVAELGLELDILHSWNIVDLGLFGFSMAGLIMSDDVGADLRGGRGRVEIDAGRRLEFRFAQPGVRFLATAVTEPFLRTGPAIVNYRANAVGPIEEEKFTHTALHWQLRSGIRFHINRFGYIVAEGHWSAPLTSAGERSRYGLTAGVGLNLPDVFGINERMDRLIDREPEPAPAPVPAQLEAGSSDTQEDTP